MSRARLAALAMLVALAACSEQPEGKPIVRTEFGDGPAKPAPEDTGPSPGAKPSKAAGAACERVVFEDVKLTHCIADPAKHRITTALAPSSGAGFGTIEGWAAGKNEGDIAFVMNGGMYGDDLKPLGYFVAGGKRLKELDRGNGSGNFYLKPNGVFYGTGGAWRVLGSNTFFNTVSERPQFGTQSGPLLVVDGKLHPEFQPDGPSRQIRNGVGVTPDGKAHFVISDTPVSFGKFARYFRDELKTANALYLDGNVSSLWDPASGRMDKRRVGPLLVVTKRVEAGE
jgi:uncharacterized protein YigE (DUF2233 family)